MNLPTLTSPTAQDVVAAAARLKGLTHRTPVLRSGTADVRVGAQLFFKCENFQRTGSFKLRGAFNTLEQFSDEQRKRGVLGSLFGGSKR